MEYVYAALLLHKAGKEVTEESVKKTLEGAGVSVDDARVKALVAALEGVNIEEAIQKSAVVAAPAAAAAPAADAGAGDSAADDAKKEAEAEKKQEEAAAGLGALFG